jgi:alkylation response protein AidB-like acyl-CoA dehydrogenase
MIDLTEEQKFAQTAIRHWCTTVLAPRVQALEAGKELPYELIRNLGATFGLADMARAAFEKLKARRAAGDGGEKRGGGFGGAVDTGMVAVLMWELSRVCPGFTLAFGATIGLFGATVMAGGTMDQKERWALPALTLDKIGAWGLTEPGAGSDAFGSMRTRARREGGGWVLSGSKTFITNAPYADCFLVYARVPGEGEQDGLAAFIVERGMPGVSTGPAMAKMGMHTSPTGEVFLDDVRLGEEHVLGGQVRAGGRVAARASLSNERFGMTPMCLGIVDRCLEESVRYAKQRVQFGKPIAEYQLVQDKIARMFVARTNMFALLLRQFEADRAGVTLPAREASAAKLYCARAATEVALEAVQVMGGTGYMRESVVEMLARDAKLLQIGGGTDEIQILRIAREVLEAP